MENLNAICLDADLHVISSGAHFPEERFGVSVRCGRLSTLDPHRDHEIRACIAKAERREIALGPAEGGGQTMLILLPTEATAPPEQRQAMAIFHQSASVEDAALALMRSYDLTAAETGVLREIIKGQSTIEVAARLNLAPSTVRTHLGRIFQKTFTRRQSELVYLATTQMISRRQTPEAPQQMRQ